MHGTSRELQQMLSEAQSFELGDPRQLQLLEELRARCPAFVPGLLLWSRAVLWAREDVEHPAPFFDEVERILCEALDASGRQPAALMGMARFMSVVRDSPQAAEALYREAAEKSLQLLEESWAGLIEALGEQDKKDDAQRTAELASRTFPQSEPLSEARRFAGLHSGK